MKKSLLIAVIACSIFAPVASFAQYVFKLPDLEKISLMNANDFETFVLTNGYSLNGKLSTPVTKLYQSDKANPNGKQNTVSRQQIPNSFAKVEFVTTDKDYYLDLKKTLATNKYKFVKEENKTVNGVQTDWFNYSNGMVSISLSSNTTDVTWYTVQIHH